jgi:hypothetical protein
MMHAPQPPCFLHKPRAVAMVSHPSFLQVPLPCLRHMPRAVAPAAHPSLEQTAGTDGTVVDSIGSRYAGRPLYFLSP